MKTYIVYVNGVEQSKTIEAENQLMAKLKAEDKYGANNNIQVFLACY